MELMSVSLWARPILCLSNASSHSLHLRATLQDLLGPGRGPDLACLSAQVDMFSYGMVLYELLSGQRPALGHHQLQIAKKLSKGIRPVLGPPEEVQFHRLQALMMECWDTKPEKVPGSGAWGPAAAARGGGCGSPECTCIGALWWCSGLRIQHCHCCGSGHYCSIGLIPDPGTPICYRHGQKSKKQQGRGHVYNCLPTLP